MRRLDFEKEHVAIWGTGILATKMFNSLKNKYIIDYFIDNDPGKNNKYFMGKRIFKPDENSINNKVIICVKDNLDIIRQLHSFGKTFVDDFVTFDMLCNDSISIMQFELFERIGINCSELIDKYADGRKIVFMYGNCQIPKLCEYLIASCEFKKKYYVICCQPVHLIGDIDGFFNRLMMIRKVDLLVTQVIRSSNSFDIRLSSENIIVYLNRNSNLDDVLIVPNLFFDVYFPQGGRMPNIRNVGFEKYGGAGIFPYPDYILDSFARIYSNISYICEIVEDKCLLPNHFLNDLVMYRFEELYQRDTYCNISITKFIEDNYLSTQLFFSRNHPAKVVFIELTKKILDYLGISVFLNEGCFKTIGESEMLLWSEVIYPSVYNNLNMNFDILGYSAGDGENEMTLKRYVEKYLNCCHNFILN